MSDNIITRRQVLGRAATISAGALSFPYIVPSSALGKAGTVAPSNRITMGFIGTGGMGTGNMNLFLTYPDVQVVSVCDVDRESNRYMRGAVCGREPAKRKVEEYYANKKDSGTYKGCDTYVDFRELLQRKDIDAVGVCTPDHWHGLVSLHAARAGKDIYCEKPLTNTIVEGRAVCEAVKKHGRVLQTGSQERSRGCNQFARDLVRSGRIGKLQTIRVFLPMNDQHHKDVMQWTKPQPTMPVPEGFDYDLWLGPTPAAPYTEKRCHFWWRFILAYGGGEITDRGAHLIDQGQAFNSTDDTGPVEIKAQGKAPKTGLFDTFMEFSFECRYANGVRLIGSSETPQGVKHKNRRGILFEGDEGWVFLTCHSGGLEAHPESLLTEEVGPQKLRFDPSDKRHPRPEHHRDFLDAIKSRKTTIANAEVGHRTATICHLINIAAQTGQKLEWDPKREVITNEPQANLMLARTMRSPWRL